MLGQVADSHTRNFPGMEPLARLVISRGDSHKKYGIVKRFAVKKLFNRADYDQLNLKEVVVYNLLILMG